MSKLNDYPRPSLTVDLVIFTIAEDDLKVLLIRRGQEPFKGRWALPGGFVEIDESLERAAARELKEEVGVTNVYLEQLYTFGEPKRDPRGRVISVSYFALVDAERQRIVAASRRAEAGLRSREDSRLRGLEAEKQDRMDDRRVRVAAEEIHALGIATRLRDHPAAPGGQAQFPQKDSGAGPDHRNQRNPLGRGAPPRAPLFIPQTVRSAFKSIPVLS